MFPVTLYSWVRVASSSTKYCVLLKPIKIISLQSPNVFHCAFTHPMDSVHLWPGCTTCAMETSVFSSVLVLCSQHVAASNLKCKIRKRGAPISSHIVALQWRFCCGKCSFPQPRFATQRPSYFGGQESIDLRMRAHTTHACLYVTATVSMQT